LKGVEVKDDKRDIFGRYDSPLYREGQRIVKGAKEAIQRRKDHSRREIEQSVKEASSVMKAWAKSRKTVIVDGVSFKKEKSSGLFVACTDAWGERWGKAAQHTQCGDPVCKCPCHKKKRGPRVRKKV